MSVLRTELNMFCDSDYGSVGHLINKDGGDTHHLKYQWHMIKMNLL